MSPPSLQPAWFLNLPAVDQMFVDICAQTLEEPDMELLCLHFCALLTVEQIAVALNLDPGAGDVIVGHLEECWGVVFQAEGN